MKHHLYFNSQVRSRLLRMNHSHTNPRKPDCSCFPVLIPSLCWRSQSSVIFSLALSITGGLSLCRLNQGICLLLSSLLPCGRINPPFSWVPLYYAWSGCTGWAGHVIKSCRLLRSKALETTTGFLKCWTRVAANAGMSYRSAGKAVFW